MNTNTSHPGSSIKDTGIALWLSGAQRWLPMKAAVEIASPPHQQWEGLMRRLPFTKKPTNVGISSWVYQGGLNKRGSWTPPACSMDGRRRRLGLVRDFFFSSSKVPSGQMKCIILHWDMISSPQKTAGFDSCASVVTSTLLSRCLTAWLKGRSVVWLNTSLENFESFNHFF